MGALSMKELKQYEAQLHKLFDEITIADDLMLRVRTFIPEKEFFLQLITSINYVKNTIFLYLILSMKHLEYVTKNTWKLT